MRKMQPILLATLFLAAGAGLSHAAGGGGEGAEHGFQGMKILFHCINFAILFGTLGFFLRKPLREFLIQRRRDVQEALNSAARAREEAESLLAEYKKKLDGADAEAKSLLDELLAHGEAEKERLVEQGQAAADKLVADARRAADREIERARVALRAEALKLASQMATERLTKEIGEGERKRYNEEFITMLDGLQS